jgi:hypothetical protein
MHTHIYHSTIHKHQAVESEMVHTINEWINKICYAYAMEYSSCEMNQLCFMEKNGWKLES